MRFKEGEGEPNVSPCIPISELVDDTNRIQLDRLEYSPDRRITYHYTAQIMSGSRPPLSREPPTDQVEDSRNKMAVREE